MGAFRRVAVAGERESTSRAIPREFDDNALHCVKRERVSFVDVGKKLFVGLLVAESVREVEAHEIDERVYVRDSHALHMTELRHRSITGGDVVRRIRRGIVAVLVRVRHGVSTGAGCDENSMTVGDVRTVRLAEYCAGISAWFAGEKVPIRVRRPDVQQKIRRLCQGCRTRFTAATIQCWRPMRASLKRKAT